MPPFDNCVLSSTIPLWVKQASQAWFENFRKTLKLASFVQSQYDPSLFLRMVKKDMLDYHSTIYNQYHVARHFQLEIDMSEYC